MIWNNLTFWKSGDCQAALERLTDIRKSGRQHCPERKNLFKALKSVDFDKVRVMLVGQDPYPNPIHATGLAFSIPEGIKPFPPTLNNLLKEYRDDLHFDLPDHGDLRVWSDQGVLLWNALPSCEAGKSLSHDWPEWHLLTQEIITKLSNDHYVVFVFLGGVAKRFSGCVAPGRDVIELSHPSPRASLSSKTPFLGSYMFSKINARLFANDLAPIDWSLPCKGSSPDVA